MGLLDRILGCKKVADDAQSELTAAEVEKIVQDYGAVLGTSAPPPGGVADVSVLPYSKERIKQALVFALRVTKDNQVREQIKVGYLSLADWQEGVGSEAVGIMVTENDMNADPLEVASRIASQGNAVKKWLPLVSKEQEKLKSELEQLGLW